MAEDKYWSRKYLFLSSAVSAGVNFLSSIIIVKALGFEAFGIWLSIKSIIQASSILNFGVSNYLLFLNPEIDFKKFKLTNYIATYISFPYTLFVFIIFLLYFNQSDLNTLVIPFLLYALTLYLSGNSTLNLRALKNGKIIFISNIIESVFGLFFSVILFLYPSLELFIYLQSIRFFIKFLIQNHFVKSFVLRIEKISSNILLIFKTSFVIHLRNWIQTISQYGDKLLLPVLYGFAVNGSLGMGSNFALPIIIMISSTNIILIPKVIEIDNLTELRKEFESKLSYIIKLSVTFAFLVPFSYWFFSKENFLYLVLGYWLSIVINLFQISSIWYYKKNVVMKSVLFLSSFIILSYLSLAITAQFFSELASIFISIGIIISLNIFVFAYFMKINIKYLGVLFLVFIVSVASNYLLIKSYYILLLFSFSAFLCLAYFNYYSIIKQNVVKYLNFK